MTKAYLFAFLMGTFKFLFAQGIAFAIDLNFLEIIVLTTLGAWVSATVFYGLSDYFRRRSLQKKRKKIKRAYENGEPPPILKNFTRMNKSIVKIKRTFGFIGIATFTPLFLSIPIGSIIVAKFYGRFRWSYFYILLLTISYSFLITILLFLLYE